MAINLFVLQILVYGYAFWLGLYLIARNLANPQLRWAGLGLTAYALTLGADLLLGYAPTHATGQLLAGLYSFLLFLPAFFWVGALIYLWPDEDDQEDQGDQVSPRRSHLLQGWYYGLLPAYLLFYGLNFFSIGPDFVFTVSPITPIYLAFASIILLPLVAALVLSVTLFQTVRTKKTLGLLIVVTLFFTLGGGILLFPGFGWFQRPWVVLGVGLDLILLGFSVAVLDAFGEGEALLPDFLRAFDAALLSVLIFAGLVVLVIIFETGVTFFMLLLLLSTIAAATARQIFSDQFDALLDKAAFAAFPQLRQTRAKLRMTASALPRVNNALDPETLDEAEFARLTRRALSHFGDFARLAASPLTRLPAIELTLQERGADSDTLERAAELKSILTASIERLKPRGKGEFGTSDEWRYYNALYFPYVVGLKPYSRRAEHNGLDPISKKALAWFQATVPERTLYNWQTTAAKLVAQDLRERQPAHTKGKHTHEKIKTSSTNDR